jgi:hypothetical protein
MLTLIVLAAGLGRRFGADKQLTRVGPEGQTLLDFTLHDAWRAGFGRVVFVLRPDLLSSFHEVFGPRWGQVFDLRSVVQDPTDLPSSVTSPGRRDKPWGTLHAVWCARLEASDRCAVVNADDLYGAQALCDVAAQLRVDPGACNDTLEACLPGYPLSVTLSPSGAVNRGLCRLRNGLLLGVEEITDIALDADGKIRGRLCAGAQRAVLDPLVPVSMNLWGWRGDPWAAMGGALSAFIDSPDRSPQAEAYLPVFWDAMVRQGKARCRVLDAPAGWVGLTHPGDHEAVRHHVAALCAAGRYADMPMPPL